MHLANFAKVNGLQSQAEIIGAAPIPNPTDRQMRVEAAAFWFEACASEPLIQVARNRRQFPQRFLDSHPQDSRGTARGKPSKPFDTGLKWFVPDDE